MFNIFTFEKCDKIQKNIEKRDKYQKLRDMEQPYPVRTATIRKLKRSHADSNIEIRNINPSRPILRSASVIKTKTVKPTFGGYESYTDEQPENLIFRRGKI